MRAGCSWVCHAPKWVKPQFSEWYGPLLCGAQTVICEGVPGHPAPARCWQIAKEYKV